MLLTLVQKILQSINSTLLPFSLILLKSLKNYILLWLVAFILIYHFGDFKETPNYINVIQWDAGWFEKIKNNGYYYSDTQQSSVPFFPAFPYTWRFLQKNFNIDNLEICIINFIFFLIGFLILMQAYSITDEIEILLLLSAPCLFFVYVPYSEGLFYLFCSWIIYGLKKEKIWIASAGLFFASMTRSIFTFILPCIFPAEILSYQSIHKKVRNIAILSLSSLLGLFIVVYFQWTKTGVWFAYFKALKHWDNKTQIDLPLLPLNTWDKNEIMFTDIFAVWVGVIAILILLFVLWSSCTAGMKLKYHNITIEINKPLLFSLGYLGFVAFFALFVKREFISANRYVFATIFYSVFILEMYRKSEFSKTSFITAIVTYLVLFYLALPIQAGDNQTMQFRMLIILIAIIAWFLYFYLKNWIHKKYLIFGIIFLGMLIQTYLFERFITGLWAG